MIYEFDNFRIEADKRLLSKSDGVPIQLTPKIFDTLLYLVRNSKKVIGKDELMAEIWKDTVVEENNLNKNISVLRRVLGENPGEHRFIVTIPGTGYKFVGDVRTINVENIPEASNNTFWNNGRSYGHKFRLVLAAAAFTILPAAILTGSFFWNRRNASVSAEFPQTMAILPFKPLVAENRDEALEFGMADTLISRLGNNREIIVRPLSSVRGFAGLEQDAVQAGRELDVESVLDGSIQRWGDKVRVNVRLIKIVDGTVLWTETFDEKFTDILIVQDAISTRVTAALALRLSGGERTTIEKRYTNSAEAYAFFLRGRYHVFRITEPEIRKGIAFYERAIAVDPNYALAYAEMADAYRVLASASFAPSRDVCPQAKELAERASQIDESLVEPHIVLGWTGFLCDREWAKAEKQLLRAVELSPNNSEARRAYAHLLSNAGRHDEAVAEGKLARELAPLTLITAALEGQFLFFAGRETEAIERLNQTLELDPNFWVSHNLLGRIYIRQGRYADAIAQFQTAVKLSGTNAEVLMQLGYAAAKSGDRGWARSSILELETIAKKGNPSAYKLAMIYNGLGESKRSLDYLEQSFDEREIHLTFMKVDTRWDNLRSEPRFINLIKQMNL